MKREIAVIEPDSVIEQEDPPTKRHKKNFETPQQRALSSNNTGAMHVLSKQTPGPQSRNLKKIVKLRESHKAGGKLLRSTHFMCSSMILLSSYLPAGVPALIAMKGGGRLPFSVLAWRKQQESTTTSFTTTEGKVEQIHLPVGRPLVAPPVLPRLDLGQILLRQGGVQQQ